MFLDFQLKIASKFEILQKLWTRESIQREQSLIIVLDISSLLGHVNDQYGNRMSTYVSSRQNMSISLSLSHSSHLYVLGNSKWTLWYADPYDRHEEINFGGSQEV